MYLVVGLGNPDKKYDNTYHNVGFSCLDRLASKLGVAFDKGECRAITSHAKIGAEKVILAKPITYMNLSGDSVIELINKYKIEQDKFIVIYDDVDIDLAYLRLRAVGSAGTHNGMKSIVARLNSTTFNRIRIGIGKPLVEQMNLADFVLSKVKGEALDKLSIAYERATEAVMEYIKGLPFEQVMGKYNRIDNV